MDKRLNPIYVTEPSLADLEEFTDLLKEVWKSKILTHNGPLVQKFEKKLESKLDLTNLALVTNGTIAIQMAIKALDLKGEIITTPFTWIATISAIQWEGCQPVFCDIDPETLNIDPKKIESLITDNTVAILPVHVFGNPCDVEEIKRIADKHELKVIYDGAHALGCQYNGSSLLEFGDISTTSLHATKLLNSGEGGACLANTADLIDRIKRIRFFGHDDSKEIIEKGLNGKMTEIHAALGLVNLKYFDEVLEDRKIKYKYYKSLLSKNDNLEFQKLLSDKINYSYFPLIFKNERELLRVMKVMNERNIFPRRYFYPSVNTYGKIMEYQSCPVSEDISKRILCLPLHKNLRMEDIENISKIILSVVE